MRFDFNNMHAFRNDPRFGRFYQFYTTARRRPSWVWRVSLSVAALVFVVPIVLLVLAAVLAFLLVFAVLGLINTILSALAAPFARRTDHAPYRDNVRVIDPNDS